MRVRERGRSRSRTGERERATPRPSLPFLLAPAVCLWLGMRIAESLAWQEYAQQGVMWNLLQAVGMASDAGRWLCVAVLCAMGAGAALATVALTRSIIARRTGEQRAGGDNEGYNNSNNVNGGDSNNDGNSDENDVLRNTRRGSWLRAPSWWAALSAFPLPTVIAAALAMGLVVGSLCWGELVRCVEEVDRSSGPYIVEITGDVVQGSMGDYSPAVLHTGDGCQVNVRVKWSSLDESLPLGSAFVSGGRFVPVAQKARSEWMFQQLQGGWFTPRGMHSVHWATSLQGAFGKIRQANLQLVRQAGGSSQGQAIVEGVVLGNTTALDGTQLDQAFKVTGLAHLVAVSGSHLAVVAMLVGWALGATRLSRRTVLCVLACIVVSYLLLTGMQPSALRSGVMALLASSSWLFGRRAHALSGLAVAVVAMLTFDPSNAFSVGFALSVLGVAGLCVFMPLAQRWAEALLPRIAHGLAPPLAMTVTAQAATMPVSVPTFGMASIGGPLSNIVVSPLITVILGGGMLSMVACSLWQPLGLAMLTGLNTVADAMAQLVLAMASIPGMAVPAYLAPWLAWSILTGAAVALWVAWPLPRVASMRKAAATVAACCVVLALLAPAQLPPGVVVLDVGQGDAILVRDGSSQVLVDTGREDTLLRAALGRNMVTHLDAVVLTHFDGDHCDSLGALQPLVDVDRVVLAQGCVQSAQDDQHAQAVLATARDLCDDQVVELSCGQRMRLSQCMTLTMVWPQEAVDDSENESSLCLLLEYDYDVDGTTDFDMLLTGDAESESLEHMIDDGLGSVDVLKVGHHGSKVSLDEPTLSALSPKVALISVGADNMYGHPNQQILELLQQHGVATWRTDECGDITLALGDGSFAIRTQNQP